MDGELPAPFGLTLGYFKRFVEIHGGREVFAGLTTADVCTKFLLPYTTSTKLSLVEHVRQQPDGHLYAKPATWFVSHAWSYLYLDVVDALDDFFREEGMDDSVSLWFCTFCNNQHEIESKVHAFNHWFGIFRSSLRTIGNVVMVLSPWNDPITLKRTWCVFKSTFLEDIQNEGAFVKMLGSIKSEKSQTTIPSDRDNIFLRIRDEVGFTKLDRMVFESIEKWMVRVVDQQIDQVSSKVNKARFLLAKGRTADDDTQFDATAAAYEESICGKPSRYLRLQNFCKAMGHQIELLSKDHEDTLITMVYLGEFYTNYGKYDLALPIFMECFERQCQVLGEDNTWSISAMSRIANVLRFQNKLKKSSQWLLRSYESHLRVFGPDHPDTICLLNNLGVLSNEIGDFESADKHLTTACEAVERLLGRDHAESVGYLTNLADTYRRQGKYEIAEEVLLWCFNHKHIDSITKEKCYRNLAYLYLAMKNYDAATTYLDLGLTYVKNRGVSSTRSLLYFPPLYFAKMETLL
ncbi:hypothetical protein AeMF1_002202 [Aphanomyces euteiches]|nr:hypothetical protein AeMF1_002202 [Aphanomyces euteiches]